MTAMFSRVWIINMVLAVLILFCWIRIWDGPDENVSIPMQTDTVQKSSILPSTLSVTAARPASSLGYESIVEMNLFSAERTFVAKIADMETDEVAVEEEVRISGEKVVLYGVVVLDDIKKALINNPVRKPGDLEFLWINEGEDLSNLRVIRIDPKQLLLGDGTKQHRINLYDPEKIRLQKPSSRRASASSQRDTPQQVINADPSPAPVSPSASQSDTKMAAPKQFQPPKPAGASKQAVTGDDDEYIIIQTPFGEIRRKKEK
jgi:hypothetical protein